MAWFPCKYLTRKLFCHGAHDTGHAASCHPRGGGGGSHPADPVVISSSGYSLEFIYNHMRPILGQIPLHLWECDPARAMKSVAFAMSHCVRFDNPKGPVYLYQKHKVNQVGGIHLPANTMFGTCRAAERPKEEGAEEASVGLREPSLEKPVAR